jgi:hypothetical protein
VKKPHPAHPDRVSAGCFPMEQKAIDSTERRATSQAGGPSLRRVSNVHHDRSARCLNRDRPQVAPFDGRPDCSGPQRHNPCSRRQRLVATASLLTWFRLCPRRAPVLTYDHLPTRCALFAGTASAPGNRRKRRAAGAKAAATGKRRAAGRKAATTRKRRAAAAKARAHEAGARSPIYFSSAARSDSPEHEREERRALETVPGALAYEC